MTPTDIQTAARDLYNAVGDSFFSDTQINNWMTEACNVFAMKARMIERIYSASTVASQQDYAYPTNTLMIKRMTVNGRKVKRVTLRDDDALTLSNQASQQSGIPVFYTDFNFTVSFRPIPDGVYTLKIYSENMAQPITNASSLEIPVLFHFQLVDYILYRMYAKDQNPQMAMMHKTEWDRHVLEAVAWRAKQKRADSFATVQDEETLPVTILGEA